MARLEYFLMKQVTVITLLMPVLQLHWAVDLGGVAFSLELVTSGVVLFLLEPSHLFHVGGNLNLAEGTHGSPVAQPILVAVDCITEYHLLHLLSVFC